MKRRHALSVLGSAAVGGCLSSAPTGESSAATTTSTEGPPDSVATTDADPSAVGTRNSEDCPPFGDDVVRVVCAPASDAPLTLAPVEQSGSLPTVDFTFTLANGTATTFQTNFYGWSVWKLVDGSWFRVAPRAWPQPLMSLSPGDTHTWDLTVDNADLDRRIPRSEGTAEATVVGLGAGTYAFGIDGWFETRSHEAQTGVAARFELRGDSLELTPVGIEDADVERDGETVVVDDYPDGEEYRANYTVTRVESPEKESREMVVEQVVRETPLRNALAHFESGIRRVRLQSETTTYPPFGIDEPRYVTYDGEHFRIGTEWEGDPPE